MLGKIIGEGRTATVYEYEKDKVIKLFNDGFDKDCQTEIDYNRFVHDSGIPAPFVYENITIDNKIGIIYQRLHGKNLGEMFGAHPLKSAEYGRMTARIHANINNTETSDLPDQTDMFTYRIQSVNELSDIQKDLLISYAKKLPNANMLCHGDLHVENYICEKDKFYVIDWLTAYSGHPASDIARTLLIMNSPTITKPLPFFKRILVKRIITKYNKAFLSTYLQLVDIDRDLIGKFMPLVAAVRLSENVPYEKEWLLEIVESGLSSL